MRIFLDTNVLVAAFATRGLCADVFRLVLAEHELLVSAALIEEVTRTLTKKIRVSDPVVREIVAFLRAAGSTVEGAPELPTIVVRDPDDAVILGEALSGGADVLVTGDKDLLVLGEVGALRILDPRGFWELVRHPGV
ncbi:MAG TPA: putative toxin-antitoxin system toxin component, PIN family [Thermoanaerobaculia bacterium]